MFLYDWPQLLNHRHCQKRHCPLSVSFLDSLVLYVDINKGGREIGENRINICILKDKEVTSKIVFQLLNVAFARFWICLHFVFSIAITIHSFSFW